MENELRTVADFRFRITGHGTYGRAKCEAHTVEGRLKVRSHRMLCVA